MLFMDHSQPELEAVLGRRRQAGIPQEKAEALARLFMAAYEEYARNKDMSSATDRLLASMETDGREAQYPPAPNGRGNEQITLL